jgi:hypothetical protein
MMDDKRERKDVVTCSAEGSAPGQPSRAGGGRVLMTWALSCLARCAVDAVVRRRATRRE